MNDLVQDIAFAWRNALKQPATALLIVVTLALGIGANSAMFSVVYHTLLAPLPFEDEDRLVILEQGSPEGAGNRAWSGPTVADFRNQNTVFSALLEYVQLPLPLVGQGDPYQAEAGVISWNFFDVLGIEPVVGRSFISPDDEEGAEPVMLLSRELWVRKFAADPAVVGSTLEIKDIIYTVVGVLPEIPSYPHANDVWVPTAGDPYRLFSLTDVDSNRQSSWTSHVLCKLKEGVTFSEAVREVDTIARRLDESYPDAYPEGYSVRLRRLADEITRDSGTTFLLMLGLAFLVVLIASANVANLNLARMAARGQELAIREAVGADPGRIRRQLLAECLLFSLLGGGLGLTIAYPGLKLLSGFASGYTPLATEIRMDASVLAFSLGLALLTGILSGAASAFQRDRAVNEALKEGGDKLTVSSSGARRRKTLLAMQYVLAFVILTTSALITLSLARLNSQETGYAIDRILAASLMLDFDFSEEWQFNRNHMRNFGRSLLAKISALPGIEGAAILAGVPLLQDVSYLAPGPIEIEGRAFSGPENQPSAEFHSVSQGYFSTLNVPFLKGRDFEQTDDAESLPVAIVNENVARRFFPDGNAIGQRIKFSGTPWQTIVGVVSNLRSADLDRVEELAVYYNFWQYPTEAINLYVKSVGDPEVLENAVTAAIHEIDPQQAVDSISPLEELKADWLSALRERAVLIGLFGLLALVVTLSGVAGIVSWNISERTREIGVHMAVGANPAAILRLFIIQGLKVYLPALLVGLAVMIAGAPLIQPFLYETAALEPGIYLASAAVLTVAVLAAIYLPAKKAGELSPMVALRAE